MRDDFILVGLKIGGSNNYLPQRWLQFYPGLEISIVNDRLTIRDNPDYIPDFFGNKVTVVSAMVGLNGSGKSSTLNYIKQLFIKEKAGLRGRGDDLIIYIYNNQLVIYVSAASRNKYDIDNDSSLTHEVLTYHEYPKLYDKLKNYTAAFYTNGLDFDQKEFETQNYFNLSTGFLLGNFGKVNSLIRNKRVINQAPVKRYQYTEFVRQMNFLNSLPVGESLEIPFKKFSDVMVNITEVTRNAYLKLRKKVQKQDFDSQVISDRFHQKFSETLKECESYFQIRKKPSNDDNFFNVVIDENLTVMFFEAILEATMAVEEVNRGNFRLDIINMFDSFGNGRYSEILKPEMLKAFTQLITASLRSSDAQKKIHPVAMRFDNISEVLAFTKELLIFVDLDQQKGQLSIRTSRPGFLKILESYFSLLQCDFITFRWPKLSAGEEALLAFFSRLDHILQNSESRNLLLLVDEGDLYFHPEWQRNYLYYVLNFINNRGGDFNKMQVLLTTHSPFLVSDIPREYQIYLAPEDKLRSEQKRFDKETFGGNLYSLFSNNFFLGGATTSEFARQKIKQEILEPMEQRLQQPSIDRIRALISKLGDPVIKDILTDRLAERINRL